MALAKLVGVEAVVLVKPRLEWEREYVHHR